MTTARDTLIRGGRVVDATGERDADVLLSGGRIEAVGHDLGEARSVDVVVDAGGCLVTPGFVDLHTHLRQPGK
jgi:dihydroorotase